MLELIGYDRQYDAVAAYLLGDVLVVEDLERALDAVARDAHRRRPSSRSTARSIDPHGVVTGGSRESASAGVLEQKREIRELEEVMARLDADLQARAARAASSDQADGSRTCRARSTSARRRCAPTRWIAVRPGEGSGSRDPRSASACEARREPARRAAGRARARRRRERAAPAEARTGARGDDARGARGGAPRAASCARARRRSADEVDGRSPSSRRSRSTRLAGGGAAAERARRRWSGCGPTAPTSEARAARIEETLADDEARARDAARGRRRSCATRRRCGRPRPRRAPRAHGERQGALEERQARLARARGRAARRPHRGRAPGADAVASSSCAARRSRLRRTSLEEHVTERYRDVELATVVYDYHLRPLVGARSEERARPSCAASSSAWARST